MSQAPLDSRREKLLAALNGELSQEQIAELEAMMESDESLRRDWEELRSARDFLRRADEAEPQPEFAWSFPLADSGEASGAKKGIVVTMRRWLVPAAVGFAAAAALFVGLLLGGLRVDRAPDGLLVKFDGIGRDEARDVPQAKHRDADRVVPAAYSGSLDYLSRDEFLAFARALVTVTDERITELEQRQGADRVLLARNLYEALTLEQQRQMNRLAEQIQLVGFARVPEPVPSSGPSRQ